MPIWPIARTVLAFGSVGLPAVVAFWSVVRDFEMLLDIGGWYALVGRFVAVFGTLVTVEVVAVVLLGLLCLPVVVWLALTHTPGWRMGAEVRMARAARRRRRAYHLADRGWKALWWVAWLARRIVRGSTR